MFQTIEGRPAQAAPAHAAGPVAARPCWAQRRLTASQAGILLGAAAILAAAAVLAPQLAAGAVFGAAVGISLLHIALRLVAWTAGLIPGREPALLRSDADLPAYTIIVPLLGEANMIPALLGALQALDYPRARLEVLLAVEADDFDTQRAVLDAGLPAWMTMLVVPEGVPRTKPRACDHALGFAAGELVVVYDAEDRPDPLQLRRAVAAFDAYGAGVVCLQARLVPFNRADNVLTRLFTLDYCQWFDGMLTGLQRLGLPVPLGGTSNHFRTAALVRAGGWDPYNVTEDADLGIRLWRLGQGVRTIASTTFEEAPVALDTWVPQRTRWTLGYLQTFFVHARSGATIGLPPLGLRGWFFLVAFVGASILLALVNPFLWALAALGLVADGGPLNWAFGPAIAALAWISLVAGNGAALVMAMLSPLRRGWWGLAPWAVLSPIQWGLVSFAAYRAVLAFIFRPHRWEKTPHGFSGDRGEEGRR